MQPHSRIILIIHYGMGHPQQENAETLDAVQSFPYFAFIQEIKRAHGRPCELRHLKRAYHMTWGKVDLMKVEEHSKR